MSGDFLELYDFPIRPDILLLIENILRKHEILCASRDNIDCHDALIFRREQSNFGTKIYALLDRNALVDVLSLARPAAEGKIKKCDDRGRLGAAMMAFFQCSNILVDPGVALYEYPATACDELKLFRRADNVGTESYAQIALSLIDHLPPDTLPALSKPTPTVDYHTTLKGSKQFKIAMLKIADLDFSELSPKEKMEHFLRWSHEQFCFLAAPTLLAAIHFTPSRKSSPLQHFRGVDRKKALKKIQNAVWDIQLISEWTRRVKKHQEEKSFWLLCSRDSALKQIAKAILAEDNFAAAEEKVSNFLVKNWGQKEGISIFKQMLHFENDMSNGARSVNQNTPPDYLEEMERDLENKFLTRTI